MRKPSDELALDRLRQPTVRRTALPIGRILRWLLAVLLAVGGLLLFALGLAGKQQDGRHATETGVRVVPVHGLELDPQGVVVHALDSRANPRQRA